MANLCTMLCDAHGPKKNYLHCKRSGCKIVNTFSWPSNDSFYHQNFIHSVESQEEIIFYPHQASGGLNWKLAGSTGRSLWCGVCIHLGNFLFFLQREVAFFASCNHVVWPRHYSHLCLKAQEAAVLAYACSFCCLTAAQAKAGVKILPIPHTTCKNRQRFTHKKNCISTGFNIFKQQK